MNHKGWLKGNSDSKEEAIKLTLKEVASSCIMIRTLIIS